ncbi:transposase, partial [candidate division KSB1 bacterium]|nr:transposase [candidate division KSB1 bacterium]
MGRSRYKIFADDPNHPYFLTCTIVNWLPFFSNPDHVSIILESLEFMQRNKRMQIFAYVILENHMHLVASAKDLSKEMGDFKSYTARCIIDHLIERKAHALLRQLKEHKLPGRTDREYQFWQHGSHPQRIFSRKMMQQKIDYTHQNPVKRGYVDLPQHWRYSSARNYMGEEG